MFHDGSKVLACDVVASLRRWPVKDAFGQALMDATDELSAPTDKLVQFRLKRGFPLLPEALAKPTALMAVVMPERLANTPPGTLLSEMVGGGPYRFLPDQRVSGARNVYAQFDGYVPRDAHGQLLRRAASRTFRPRGVADHARSSDAGGGAAPRRVRLGGTTGDGFDAVTAQGREPDGRGGEDHRLYRCAAVQPVVPAVRQPGDSPRRAEGGQPDRFYGRGCRRGGPQRDQRACRVLCAELALCLQRGGAADLATQKALARDIQLQAFEDVPCMPLGLYYQPVAYPNDLMDMMKGLILFTGVRRA